MGMLWSKGKGLHECKVFRDYIYSIGQQESVYICSAEVFVRRRKACTLQLNIYTGKVKINRETTGGKP